jgi:TolA-binding protein
MRHLTFALAAAFVFSAPAAFAQQDIQSQEGIALQNEIEQLQSQVQQLQSSPSNGGSSLGNNGDAAGSDSAPPQTGGAVANLLTQVQQLQGQVQDLNGKVDQLQNEVDTQNAQTQKAIGDLKFQIGGGAPGGAPAPGGAAPAPQAVTPPQPQAAAPTAASGSPKDQLHAAIAAYDKRDFSGAASIAQALVTHSKGAPEAYRAQYLIGQADSAQGDAQDAAIAYDATYNLNRAGTYAAGSLLGLAGSLADINQSEAACDTLASFNSQFTSPSASQKSRVAAITQKAGCH